MCFGIPMLSIYELWTFYEHSMYISRIRISGYVTCVSVLRTDFYFSVSVIFSYAYTHAYTCRIIHNDIMIKDERRLLYKICTSPFICNVCVWEGAGDRTETAIFWPPLLWPSAFYLSRSPGLLNPRPSGPAAQLYAGWWLSLLHLISNFSGPQLNWGSEPLRPGMAFLTTSRL